MSRSGYTDDYEQWQVNLWRAAVGRAIAGKRGQALLCEMLEAFDAMPDKRLISEDLISDGRVCALGAVGVKRGMDMSEIDPDDHEAVAAKFGIAHAMACELMYLNDEWGPRAETPEQRFVRMRAWVVGKIRAAVAA